MKKNHICYEICCDIPDSQPYYYFYKIINIINNKFYYGVHKTKNINDGYSGSGYSLKDDIKLFGIENFKKYILCFFDNESDMYTYEQKIITQDLINNKNCYNIKLGGYGGWSNSIGYVTVRNSEGNCMRVPKDDKRFLSGELKHNMVDRINVIELKTNKHIQITKDEYYNNKDKYISHQTNKVMAKDLNNNIVKISKNEYENGNYVGSTSGFGVFKDKNGNSISCKIDDPRVLSGELVGYTKGFSIFKCKDDFSKTLFLEKNDPRVLSGQYVGINYGMVTAYDINGNKFRVSKFDKRLKTGELIYPKIYKDLLKNDKK